MKDASNHENASSRGESLAASYVLPIAAQVSQAGKLSGYLHRLSRTMNDVIVVDGSPKETFEAHARAWSAHVRHLRPEMQTTNGKVAGVMTGVRAARHECVIIADDDVRYRRAELLRMLDLLQQHEVVRPQNFFHPLPWHARWDTARSLLNRLGDGDWPGTLGVRRSLLLDAGGYSGEVLFENLELVRTIRAAGGREAVPLDLFVVRRPPSATHFFSQRLRQAYDEWARPVRFAAQLALLPAGMLVVRRGPGLLLAAAACGIAAAEIGRRKGKGRTVFPSSSALWAPAWLAERSVTSWMALSTRLLFGGVRYRATRLKNAATPPRILEENEQKRRKSGALIAPNAELTTDAPSSRSARIGRKRAVRSGARRRRGGHSNAAPADVRSDPIADIHGQGEAPQARSLNEASARPLASAGGLGADQRSGPFKRSP